MEFATTSDESFMERFQYWFHRFWTWNFVLVLNGLLTRRRIQPWVLRLLPIWFFNARVAASCNCSSDQPFAFVSSQVFEATLKLHEKMIVAIGVWCEGGCIANAEIEDFWDLQGPGKVQSARGWPAAWVSHARQAALSKLQFIQPKPKSFHPYLLPSACPHFASSLPLTYPPLTSHLYSSSCSQLSISDRSTFSICLPP